MQLPQTVELKGIRVLTSKQLAECYETKTDIIKMNFSRNRNRYVDGKHYISLTGDELKEFKNQVTKSYLVDGRTSRLYLWTEKGALLHAKSLNTEKAWEVYDYLVDFYFRAKEPMRAAGAKEKMPVPMKTIPMIQTGMKEMRVDIPENREAQKLIADMRKYLAGMDALLDVYSMYLTEEKFRQIAAAIGEMEGKIMHVGCFLSSFEPRLVENFL